MVLVALVKPPPDQDRAAKVLAETMNGPLAEARMRLSAVAPALIARLEEAPARSLASALGRAGVTAVLVNEPVPTDAQRSVARTVQLEPGLITFSPRSGAILGIADGDIALIVRGLRSVVETTSHTEKTKKFSVGKAIVTQGLSMTRTEERTVRETAESSEHFLLVYDRNGECGAIYDKQISFQSFGVPIQPTTLGNINWLGQELRRRAPGAVFNDALLKLGRRTLPFVVPTSASFTAGSTTVTRSETVSSVDVLAAALFQAVREGKLP